MRTSLALAAVVAMTCACARRDCCDRPVDHPAEQAESWTWERFEREAYFGSLQDGLRIALEGVIRELDGRIFVVKPKTEARTYTEIRDATLPDDYRRCRLLVWPDDPTVRSLIDSQVRVTGRLTLTKSADFDWDDEPVLDGLDVVRIQRLR